MNKIKEEKYNLRSELLREKRRRWVQWMRVVFWKGKEMKMYLNGG